jgi:hypothetical protein
MIVNFVQKYLNFGYEKLTVSVSKENPFMNGIAKPGNQSRSIPPIILMVNNSNMFMLLAQPVRYRTGFVGTSVIYYQDFVPLNRIIQHLHCFKDQAFNIMLFVVTRDKDR